MKSTLILNRRRLLWAAGAALLVPIRNRLLAQEKTESPPAFSSDVKVVNVFATVRDKEGKLVTDLAKDDFELQEDGSPQSIRYFSRQSDQPLTLGLLVDTSGSERRMIGTEQAASQSFLNEILRLNKDRAFVLHFDRDVELLQDLTTSREKLDKALSSLGSQSSQGRSDPDGSANPDDRRGTGRRQGGGTTLYDAIYLAANDVLAKEQGRKAILLLTDGVDRHSKISLAEAIAAAQRADTLAYSVYIVDENHGGFGNGGGGFPGGGRGGRGGGGWGSGGGPMGGGWPGGGGGGRGGGRGGSYEPHVDGKKILQQISHETGGAFGEVTKKKSLSDIYTQMREELSNQYSLGYTPSGTLSPGYHRIQVTVKRKGLTVDARQGYYTKS